ncbi:MAG: hypothetical protein HUU37_04040 [Bdellovibrionales bacterium]|nr:hypothetical protein [Bdellovibrionales bacterium]
MTRKNPVWPWVAAFLVLALAVTQDGGTNPLSRYAAMRAVTESGTLHINRYVDWTHDWAESPNGNYYSNKAPGAALLGLPLFALTDLVAAPLEEGRRDEKGRRPHPSYPQHLALVLLLQLLPFSGLVLAIARWLRERGISHARIHLFALLALFGNTASILMNSYFGHGMAACLMLAFSWFALQERFFAAGIALGLSALTDYGGLLALPFAALLAFSSPGGGRALWRLALGGAAPAVLWAWYHTAAFGGPLRLASLYINPAQVAGGSPDLFARTEILAQLLFGQGRGLLVTQPWVLVLIGLALFSRKADRRETRAHEWFCLATLSALLLLHASTWSWQAGFSPGPRYLSAILPSLALALALRPVPAAWVPAVLLATGIALGLRALLYPFSLLAPPDDLWLTHLAGLLSPKSGTPVLRLAVFVAVMGAASAVVWKRFRRLPASSES